MVILLPKDNCESCDSQVLGKNARTSQSLLLEEIYPVNRMDLILVTESHTYETI